MNTSLSQRFITDFLSLAFHRGNTLSLHSGPVELLTVKFLSENGTSRWPMRRFWKAQRFSIASEYKFSSFREHFDWTCSRRVNVDSLRRLRLTFLRICLGQKILGVRAEGLMTRSVRHVSQYHVTNDARKERNGNAGKGASLSFAVTFWRSQSFQSTLRSLISNKTLLDIYRTNRNRSGIPYWLTRSSDLQTLVGENQLRSAQNYLPTIIIYPEIVLEQFCLPFPFKKLSPVRLKAWIIIRVLFCLMHTRYVCRASFSHPKSTCTFPPIPRAVM